jgi:hypothetical protein
MENAMSTKKTTSEMPLLDDLVKTVLPALCAKYLPDTIKSDREMCEAYVDLSKEAYILAVSMVSRREQIRKEYMKEFGL